MHATILGLGKAVPKHFFLQKDVPEILKRILKGDEEKNQQIKMIYRDTAILKRHSVVTDFSLNCPDFQFFSEDYPNSVPCMTQRNEIYKKEAHLLAFEAAQKAIENWGGSPAELTHVISVSCTGMMAPGIEFDLIRHLKLKYNINRLGINFMGCFGAFKGLDVARAFAKENSKNRILVVCTELCSLHFQSDFDSENLVGNSVFADGSAAAIIGMQPRSYENPLREIVHAHSSSLENTIDKITWEASHRGYLMHLSHTVPVLIKRHIRSFIDEFLPKNLAIEECDWPIHPGGKSIIQAIERALHLKENQTEAAWRTLANYGNMSSATFLFVLNELCQQKQQKEWAIGLAFGPGLSMEGVLLRKP
jgi:predicted naringenin-chalcone synthase